MLETAKALYDFYSGFGIPAYSKDNVPDDATFPYITYTVVDGDWDTPRSHYCMVYMRTRSNQELLKKADEIKEAIGTGLRLPCDGGCLYLHYENAEIMSGANSGTQSEQDSDVRSVYINMQLDVLHL